MKNKVVILIFTIFALSFVMSCKTDVSKRLPLGNVKEVNTKGHEFAPINIPLSQVPQSPCDAEFDASAVAQREQVKPSSAYLAELFGLRVGEKIELISYITNTHGILSIPHPPDSASAAQKNIPFFGITGGTDLFEFKYENENFTFKNLGSPINSKTWDSHPFAAADASGKILMLWSSDRSDNAGGFSSPYSLIKNLKNEDSLIGNTDLYYSFYSNGKWSAPQNFARFNRGINTIENDESPFIYCLCFNTVMMFSSNRGNQNINDYDLYSVNIQIDFAKEEIRVLNEPSLLNPKSYDGINTEAKEFFPFIPKPYSGDAEVPNYVYFSSDRFKNEQSEGKDAIKNVGGFDIYKFPIELKCQPPKVTYIVHLLDSINPSVPLKGPFKVELLDESSRVVITESGNPSTFNLSYDKKYRSRGTSLYDGIECNGKDSVVSSYKIVQRRMLDTVIENVVKVEYDSIVGGRTVVYYDTTLVKEVLLVSELSKVSATKERVIKELRMANDSVHIVYFDIKQRIENESGRVIKKHRNEIVRERVQKVVESYISAKDALNLSVKSQKGFVPENIFNEDVVIHDTIYVVPDYFRFPPCKWEYITLDDDYRRNVPYFQTGFWEVNTAKNFDRHVSELRSKQYAGASFIELQPENMYFGYRRGEVDEETQEARERRWENRVAKYRQYSRQVDRNLKDMVYEIADIVLPKFHKLDSIIPELESKLIIQLEAYSDFRDIIGGEYLSDETVKYYGTDYNEAATSFQNHSLIEIGTGTKMDEKNVILSKLRAYFGYKELIALLEKNPLFKQYLDKGLVVLPTAVSSEKEFNEALAKAKIIVTTVGKRIDEKAISSITAYKGEEGDYYMLDSVRRVNVVVHRVQYGNGRIIKTDCCSETPLPTRTSGLPIEKPTTKKDVTRERFQAIIEDVAKNVTGDEDVKVSIGSVEIANPRFYQISCGSFQSMQKASELLNVLIKSNKTDFAIETTEQNQVTYFRVRSKMYSSLIECEKEFDEISKLMEGKSIRTEMMIMPIE